MTAAQPIDQSPDSASTAVAPTTPYAQMIAQREHMRGVQKALRNKSWGKDLPEPAIKALVLWAEKRGIDGATEVDVLGGNIYLNHRYYLRRLAQKVEAGEIEYAYADHVQHDPRLEALAVDAKAPQDVRDRAMAEHYRRVMERSKHNLRDQAAAAVVFRIKVRGMVEEITGAKAVGGGIRHNDPVGEAHPMETAESRAARRAIRQITDSFPDLRAEMEVVEAEAKLVSVEIQQGREMARVEAARPSALSGRNVHLSSYDDDGPVAQLNPGATVQPEIQDMQRKPRPTGALPEDPYADDRELDRQLAAEDDHQ